MNNIGWLKCKGIIPLYPRKEGPKTIEERFPTKDAKNRIFVKMHHFSTLGKQHRTPQNYRREL